MQIGRNYSIFLSSKYSETVFFCFNLDSVISSYTTFPVKQTHHFLKKQNSLFKNYSTVFLKKGEAVCFAYCRHGVNSMLFQMNSPSIQHVLHSFGESLVLRACFSATKRTEENSGKTDRGKGTYLHMSIYIYTYVIVFLFLFTYILTAAEKNQHTYYFQMDQELLAGGPRTTNYGYQSRPHLLHQVHFSYDAYRVQS